MPTAKGHTDLLSGSDGNLYGEAGPNAGMIFELTPGGTASSVYTFCSLSGCGEGPSGLVQATDGSFYGTTSVGGSHAKGTLYHLATGLPAFVHPLVTYGAVGSKVRILGSYLKGTTAVFFNGTPAAFEVGSNATNLTATRSRWSNHRRHHRNDAKGNTFEQRAFRSAISEGAEWLRRKKLNCNGTPSRI